MCCKVAVRTTTVPASRSCTGLPEIATSLTTLADLGLSHERASCSDATRRIYIRRVQPQEMEISPTRWRRCRRGVVVVIAQRSTGCGMPLLPAR
jgi:hypothetical protein